MGWRELNEKAQSSLSCQDSYNAIIKAPCPLPTDKPQVCWTEPRFQKVRLLVLLASCSLQSKYLRGGLRFSPKSSQSVGWPWLTDGLLLFGVVVQVGGPHQFEKLLAYIWILVASSDYLLCSPPPNHVINVVHGLND